MNFVRPSMFTLDRRAAFRRTGVTLSVLCSLPLVAAVPAQPICQPRGLLLVEVRSRCQLQTPETIPVSIRLTPGYPLQV